MNTAVAITAALAQGANVILAGIVGGLGALQIAAIVANAPKPPAFADGGVVGLPRTYHSTYANGGIVEANTPRGVDAVDTTLANREMVLNDEQQSNLFGAIAGNQLGGGEQPIILYITFNVTKLSDEVVSVINDGLTRKVDVRMVG